MQYLQQLSGRPVGLWPGLGQYPDVTVNAASSTKQIGNPWEGMLRPKQSSSLLDTGVWNKILHQGPVCYL